MLSYFSVLEAVSCHALYNTESNTDLQISQHFTGWQKKNRLIFKLLLWLFWRSVKKPILFNTYMTDYTSIPQQTTKQMSPPRMPSGCWITFLLQWHGLNQEERGFSQGGNYLLLIRNLDAENRAAPKQCGGGNKFKKDRDIQPYLEMVNMSLATNILQN